MNRIILINNQYSSLKYPTTQVESLFHALDAFQEFSIPSGELSIAFFNDPTLAQLHRQFLNDPSTTDVITFPGNNALHSAGEICVSVDHALKLSKELHIPFPQELTLYLAHGWLHLAGLDDAQEDSRYFMRKAEDIILEYLKSNHAIPSFSFS